MRGIKIINPVHRSWEPAQLYVRTARDSPSVAASSTACNACNDPAGTADVDLSSFITGLVASSYYRWDLFCTGALIVLFTYTTGGVWTGSKVGGGALTLNCDGEEDPVTFTITLAVTGTGHLPGEVKITVTVAGDDWVWVNRESWQPDQDWEFTLISGDINCPCAPFRKRSCLVPDDGT